MAAKNDPLDVRRRGIWDNQLENLIQVVCALVERVDDEVRLLHRQVREHLGQDIRQDNYGGLALEETLSFAVISLSHVRNKRRPLSHKPVDEAAQQASGVVGKRTGGLAEEEGEEACRGV